MGFYIQGPVTGKVSFLIDNLGAREIARPEKREDIPEDKSLVVVVHGFFDAALVVTSMRDFEDGTDEITDDRPRTYLLADRKIAELHSGYTAHCELHNITPNF